MNPSHLPKVQCSGCELFAAGGSRFRTKRKFTTPTANGGTLSWPAASYPIVAEPETRALIKHLALLHPQGATACLCMVVARQDRSAS